MSDNDNVTFDTSKSGKSHQVDKLFYPILLIAITVMLGFIVYVLRLDSEACSGFWETLKQNNMLFYFTSLIIFAATFLGLLCIMSPLSRLLPQLGTPRTYSKYFGFLCMAALVGMNCLLLLQRFFVTEFEEFGENVASLPFHQTPVLLLIVFSVILLGLIFYFLIKNNDVPNGIAYFGYAVAIVLTFAGLFTSNLFHGDGHLHHTVAYLETIFNTAAFVPFDVSTTGIYGHYALFFLIPMKLFGSHPLVATGMIALYGVAATACLIYIYHNLLKKNWLRICATLASILTISTMRLANYWQVQPHRILFPCVILAFLVYLWKHQKRMWGTRWMWLGYGLCTLSILWNTETGLFCAVAFTLSVIVQEWQIYKWYQKHMWFTYASCVFLTVLSLFVSIGIVNIYNLLCGGELIFRTFFFPIFEQNYMLESLRYDMVFGNHAWVYNLILFLVLSGAGLRHTLLFKKAKSQCWSAAPIAVACGALALFNFSYYANRAAYYNLDICIQLAFVAMALVISSGEEDLYKRQERSTLSQVAKKSFRLMAIIVTVFCAAQNMYTMVTMNDKYSIGIWSYSSLKNESIEFSETVPKNIYGIGTGISFVYELVGWDNYGHFRDMSDMLLGGTVAMDAMVDEVLSHDSFVILIAQNNDETLLENILARDASYKLVSEYDLQGTRTLAYYVR